jgi:hypothetical protein
LGKNGARLGTSRCFSAVSGPGRLLVVFLCRVVPILTAPVK